MSALPAFAVLFGVIAAVCVIVVLGQLWAMGGQAEEPIGPFRAVRPDPPPPAVVPADFRSLIVGEAMSWKWPDKWQILTRQLDEIETSLGGTPDRTPAPEEMSAEWLEQRIKRIEEIAGPLPSPILQTATSAPNPRFWTRR